MVTVIQDKAEGLFFNEIITAADRIVGLLAPIIVDNRLTAANKARWTDAPTSVGTIFGDLFRDGGELGDFGTRIKVGFAMGLYGEKGFKDLRLISKIRNEFAHQMTVNSFTDQPVIDYIKALQLAYDYPAYDKGGDGKVVDDISKSPDMWNILIAASPIANLTDQKSKFLRTVELLTILLLREQHEPTSKTIPRF